MQVLTPKGSFELPGIILRDEQSRSKGDLTKNNECLANFAELYFSWGFRFFLMLSKYHWLSKFRKRHIVLFVNTLKIN